jgi:hypothetical protein
VEVTEWDVLAEVLRRNPPVPNVIDDSFKEQAAFIRDPAKWKVGYGTRRIGKGYGAGEYFFDTMLRKPGSLCFYIGLTLESAILNMWEPVLHELDRKHRLDFRFLKSPYTVINPRNDSFLRILGADKDAREMEKLLGNKFDLSIFDECQSWRNDLGKFVELMRPAAIDRGGTICLLFTPGNYKGNLAYALTKDAPLEVGTCWRQPTPKDARWHIHRWTAMENPYMREKWVAELREIDETRPLFKQTPTFKQWYLGEWSIDESILVYKFREDRNWGTPPLEKKYETVIGVDLGWNDPTAFVVGRWSPHDRRLYFVAAFEKSGMDFTEVANTLKHLQEHWQADFVVVDGANKQGVEEMRRRHEVQLQAADKRGKNDFIGLMNDDLVQGNIRVAPEASSLVENWLSHVWDEKKLQLLKKYEENRSSPNHLADAALYAWRWSYAHLATPEVTPVKAGTAEWYVEQERVAQEEARMRSRTKRNLHDGQFQPNDDLLVESGGLWE